MLFRIYLTFFVLRYLGVNASEKLVIPHCGINEVRDCECLPQPTCDDPCAERDEPHVCPLGPDGNCVKKCICKPGFVRRSDGLCTHCTQCTPLDQDDCCDDEEFQSCGTFCPETCANRGPTACTKQCVRGCFCKKGLVRDAKGFCVDPDKCPKSSGCKGDPNAELVKCPDPCPATCANGGVKPKICPRLCLLEGCQCLPGFVLDDEGKCIRLKDCPPIGCNGDPNAHPGCGINCGRTCATFKNPPKVCPLLCRLHACDCNDGFVLDQNLNKCVKPKDCTPICSINETFSQHPVICPPQTCDAIGKAFKCPANLTGPPACICKEGYLRNKENECVLKADCVIPHCGINEVRDCECLPQPTCDDPCAERDEPHVCPLGPDGNCVKKCICKPGFVRRSDGLCTHCTQCTPLDQDDCCDDEEFQSCGTFCPETCANRGPTACTKQCVRGCFCKKGLVRDADGFCVDPDKCPKSSGCKGDPNAELVKCPDPCPATCANGGVKPKICPRLCLLEGCQCLPGFVLDDEGKCIRLKDCPPIGCNGDPNAHPGCGINCGRTCATFKNPPKVCPLLCRLHACDCNDGFVLDQNLNKCVKPKDCTPICSIYETFSQHPVICPPQTCDAIGKAFKCPANLTGPPACICKEGYLRNKENECVLKADCDTCGGDDKARPGCGNPCGRTCADIDQPPHACPAFCRDGCDCMEGFWLDIDTNKCVLPKDCPKKCKCKGCKGDPNAELVKCPDPCPATCANGGVKPKICPRLCLLEGCQCLPGFVLDDEGKCIRLKDCPPKEKCEWGCKGDPNAELVKCPTPCPATCANGGVKPKVCPALCILEGCQCLPGFVVNNQGKCIRFEDCPIKG